MNRMTFHSVMVLAAAAAALTAHASAAPLNGDLLSSRPSWARKLTFSTVNDAPIDSVIDDPLIEEFNNAGPFGRALLQNYKFPHCRNGCSGKCKKRKNGGWCRTGNKTLKCCVKGKRKAKFLILGDAPAPAEPQDDALAFVDTFDELEDPEDPDFDAIFLLDCTASGYSFYYEEYENNPDEPPEDTTIAPVDPAAIGYGDLGLTGVAGTYGGGYGGSEPMDFVEEVTGDLGELKDGTSGDVCDVSAVVCEPERQAEGGCVNPEAEMPTVPDRPSERGEGKVSMPRERREEPVRERRSRREGRKE